jgi:PEP-CTERM motif
LVVSDRNNQFLLTNAQFLIDSSLIQISCGVASSIQIRDQMTRLGWPGKKSGEKMMLSGRFKSAVAVVGFALCCLPCSTKAALQVELGEVNTSVGLAPTTTKNKWALQTDPAINNDTTTGPDLSQDIPMEGMLNNSFDPTKFTLDLDPFPNPTTVPPAPAPGAITYGLGFTVMGLGAYQVVGFEVETVGGGLISVQQNPTFGQPDVVTGDIGGTPDGNILDIHFKLVPSMRNLALPATEDQLFYQINLTQIPTDPNFDPGVATTFVNNDSFLMIGPSDPSAPPGQNIMTGPSGINGSSNVPEPTSLSLLGLGAISLVTRRRRR